MDGELGITLPTKTFTDEVISLTGPEVFFSVNGKPQASLKCGSYKGVGKGVDASELPAIPVFDFSNGVSLKANVLKEMILKTAFAVSMDDSRPVLTEMLLTCVLCLHERTVRSLKISPHSHFAPRGEKHVRSATYPQKVLRKVMWVMIRRE